MAKQFKDFDEALEWLQEYEPHTDGQSAQWWIQQFDDEYAKLDAPSQRIINKIRGVSYYEGRDTWRLGAKAAQFRSDVTEQLGDTYEPMEQAEGPFSPLDIDQNGVVDALSDGLLYLRYAFGLTGDALTDSAIAENANRSPEEAQEYLEYITEEAKNDNPALYDIFDIDGDGNLDALTDGLLLLRYAFGLTGDALTRSAVAEESPLALQLESGEITAKEFTDAVQAKLSPYIDGTQEDGGDFISVNDDGSLNVPMSLGGEPTYEGYAAASVRSVAQGLEATAAEYNLTVAEFVEIYDYNGDGQVSSKDGMDYLAYSQGDLDKSPKYVSEQAQTEAAQEIAALQLAKQQALDNYTGDGKLPEGSDESHIQKRLQHWQDNPPAHFSGVVARNDEFNQIKQDYGTELGKLDLSALGIMDLDNDDVPDSADTDKDGDGVANNVDLFPDDGSETVDSDKDGIGDYADTDDDNDGVLDYEDPRKFDEDIWDVDQLNDSDNDGTNDYEDAFPNDSTETVDSDNDGTGDNADAFPQDASETTDSDNDSVGDNADAFPQDASETTDSDNDGTGDNADAFPQDASETTDSDNDSVGDNADAFPNDGTETVDSDNDGTGDNADAFPQDASETTDSDNDSVGDNADAFPQDASEYLDSDNDGTGDNADVAKDNENIQTQVQLDEYNKQQALDNYTGEGDLPEGYGEEQVRKRFEYWRDNPPVTDAGKRGRGLEAEGIAIGNPDAYAAVAVDFNKDGGTSGVLDLDFFDANPDIAGVTTKAEADEYDAAQARIKALNDYTGAGTLPEGSGETQVRKRFQYWRDNAPANAEAEENRKTEAVQIAADYSTAFNAIKADFDTDEDGVIDLLDIRKDDPKFRTQQDVDDHTAQVERDKDLGVKITRPEGAYAADYSFTNSDARTMEFGYQGYDMPLTPDQLIEGYFAILNGEEWTDPRW